MGTVDEMAPEQAARLRFWVGAGVLGAMVLVSAVAAVTFAVRPPGSEGARTTMLGVVAMHTVDPNHCDLDNRGCFSHKTDMSEIWPKNMDQYELRTGSHTATIQKNRAEIKDLKARLKILVDQLSANDFKDGKLETVKIGMPGDLAAFNELMLSSIKAAIASVTGLPAEQITVTVAAGSVVVSAKMPKTMANYFVKEIEHGHIKTLAGVEVSAAELMPVASAPGPASAPGSAPAPAPAPAPA